MPTCESLLSAIKLGQKKLSDCPFSLISSGKGSKLIDFHKNPVDFVISAFPGEPSARKILLPFRSDLVEKWDIKPGDIITGRPMGAGCPVQHVLRVFDVSKISGVLTCHVVGPFFSRGLDVKDFEAYHMIGFEGIAKNIQTEPEFGRRMNFLPEFCMMNMVHSGIVNLIADTESGLLVRVEDIIL